MDIKPKLKEMNIKHNAELSNGEIILQINGIKIKQHKLRDKVMNLLKKLIEENKFDNIFASTEVSGVVRGLEGSIVETDGFPASVEVFAK